MKLSILFLGDYMDEFSKFKPIVNLYNYLKTNKNFNIDIKVDTNVTYDVVIVLNYVKENTTIKVKKGNVFALMQEPGEKGFHLFMYKGLSQYDKVFSPIVQSKNTIKSINYISWRLHMPYDEICNLHPVVKNKVISCILSDAQSLEGHKKRYAFLNNYLLKSSLPIDYYGRGINFIEKKEEGLLDYKYSIAIENSSKDYYFSEKIIDCFLTYTVPIYYGCTNIHKFFPEKSYIWLDINNPTKAIQTIQDILKNENDYNERLPYIQEARELYFKKYNLLYFISDVLSNYYEPNLKNKTIEYTIKPTNKSPLWKRKIDELKFIVKKTIKSIFKKIINI